jgi:hypothetical protein
MGPNITVDFNGMSFESLRFSVAIPDAEFTDA